MGLFNRGKRKTPEEEYRELYNTNMSNIEAANYVVRLDFAIGEYGNEDIVAGSMIGSTGKYLMMSKYGDLKWANTTMALLIEGVQIHYNGTLIYYSDILEIRNSDNKGLLNVDKQLVLVTHQGDYIFKGSAVFVDAITNIILGSRDRYNGWINDGIIKNKEELTPEEWDKVIKGEPLNRKNSEEKAKAEADMDRLIRLGELHERGLLSDEEFAEAKKKLL